MFEDNLPRLSKCLHHLIVKEIDKHLSGYGLTPQQGMIVIVLSRSENNALTQCEIQNKLGISKSTCSGIIKRAIENGFLYRKNGKIHLSQKGKEVINTLNDAELSINEKITSKISNEEKDNLIKSLNKVIESLKED